MLDNNIQNNTQNENEKVVQNGIQNVHQKFTARQNELRLYIINFTIDNKRCPPDRAAQAGSPRSPA